MLSLESCFGRIFTSFYFNPLTKLIRYFCCFCGLIVRRDFSCPFRQSLGLSLVLFSSFIDVELLNRGCLDFKLILMRYRNERRSVRAFVISEDLSENSRKPRSCQIISTLGLFVLCTVHIHWSLYTFWESRLDTFVSKWIIVLLKSNDKGHRFKRKTEQEEYF